MSAKEELSKLAQEVEKLAEATEEKMAEVAVKILELPLESKQEAVRFLLGLVRDIRGVTDNFKDECAKVKHELTEADNESINN